MNKKLKMIILLGALSGAIIGCSSDEVEDDRVTLTIATYSDPFEVDIVTGQIEAYMEQNPNINLVIEPVSGDFWEVLKTRMVSNNEPDIFYMDIFQAGQFIDANKLAPLDSLLTAEDLADFEPALLNGFRGQDGTLYGIPKDFSTLALYYNKKMFTDAGLEAPTTWDDLTAVAKALTKDGVVGLSLQNGLDRAQPFFYSNGGTMMKDGKPTLNNPKNIEAYEYWIGLIKDGYAQTPQQLGVGWNGDAFASEIVAMTIEGNWMVNSLLELAPDLDYGVVPIPYKETPASMQFTVAYSMSKNTDYPEEAKDVIKFLTSAEQQQVVADAGRAMPSRNAALEEFKKNWPERAVFADQAPVASEFNYGVISATVVDEAAKAMERVLLDDKSTVQQAFDAAQANIDKALSKQ
ncbi:ABC transporter substrate-binding protein [Candidatus Epulonipiscium viviparus]|uniref:ABC transporter substrate-binding protein n=1 Tax=Candidatus Epulonipiscium viviparus TaxID=420336 RepID=UPI0027380B6D|nr:ABC transporter substrate-binding protein [Candidatus Epulopiscium viviparus]